MPEPEASTNAATPLPSVECACDADAVGARLDALAKRGKLPDYARDRRTFRVCAYGNLVDSTLHATITDDTPGSARIAFNLRRQWKVPLIVAGATVLTVWPGMWLTDSMLSTYFEWYRFQTWMWYLPVMVAPMPVWLWLEIKKSGRLADESARELIERVRVACG